MAFKPLLFLLFATTLHAAPGFFDPWGKDADLMAKRDVLASPAKRNNPLNKAAENLILFHQNHISPLHGARSNFRPTSSRYMLIAMRRYGFFTGYLMGCDRLLRENKDPWVYRTRIFNNKRYKFDPTW